MTFSLFTPEPLGGILRLGDGSVAAGSAAREPPENNTMRHRVKAFWTHRGKKMIIYF